MTLTFYYVPNSTSNVTSAVLAELERDHGSPLCTRVELSIQAGDTKAPSYLKTVNPNGRVPAIVHDGVSIWESAAITMYLGEMFGAADAGGDKSGSAEKGSGNPPLYPAQGPRRGEAMKWIVWANVTIADAGGRLAAALPAGSDGGVEAGSADSVAEDSHGESGKRELEVESAKKDLARWLAVLDGALEGRPYLLGEEYSLVDTHLWTFISWLALMKVDLGPYGNIAGWKEKVRERPALRAELGGS